MALSKMFLIALTLFHVIIQSKPELLNVFVERNVRLDTQLIKVYTDITFVKNDDTNNYTYLIDRNVKDFYIKFLDLNGRNLNFTKALISYNNTDYIAFNVTYPNSFMVGEKILLGVQETHVNKVTPFYAKKKFDDPDLVRYTGNTKYCSIYKTKKSSVSYYYGNNHNVRIISPEKTNSSYYHFKNLKPYSFDEIIISYIFNKPLLHVLNLERVIDVSHFGKIIITEEIEIKNTGAKVYGPFKPSILDKWIYTSLPLLAENVQVYDELGAKYDWSIINYISYKTFKFKTRYPLYGGWKTKYTIKYSLPCYGYLKKIDTYNYRLEMPIVDHVLGDVIIDNLKTKLILPENSHYYYIYVPSFYLKQEKDENTLTLLSSYGRPTVVLTANSIVEDHYDDFVIKYYFNPIYLLRVPLKLGLIVYGIFLFIILTRTLTKFED